MKKILFLAASAVLLSSRIAWAQDTATDFSSVPPPKQPYVARAPEKSAWTIEFTPNPSAIAPAPPVTPGAPSANPKAPAQKLKQQDWTKSNGLMKCVNEWSDGSTTEEWVVGAVRFAQDPKGKGIHIYSPDVDTRYHDFRNSDFAMLDWMTPKDYVQVVKHGNDVCYLFTAKTIAASPLQSGPHSKSLAQINAPTSATSVFISVQSGLPMEIDNGDGKYIFRYLPPPTEDLKLPPPFLAMWKAFRAH